MVLFNGHIYEGLYCVNCEECKAIFTFELINVDVATLSIFNFPYLFIIFFYSHTSGLVMGLFHYL